MDNKQLAVARSKLERKRTKRRDLRDWLTYKENVPDAVTEACKMKHEMLVHDIKALKDRISVLEGSNNE